MCNGRNTMYARTEIHQLRSSSSFINYKLVSWNERSKHNKFLQSTDSKRLHCCCHLKNKVEYIRETPIFPIL